MQIQSDDLVYNDADSIRTTVGVLEAVNDAISIDATIFQSVSVQILDTFSGTIQFEVSNTGLPSDFVAKNLTLNTGGTFSSSSTATGVIYSGDIGAKFFRVRASALASGTPRVVVVASSVSLSNTSGNQSASIVNTPSVLVSPVTGNGFLTSTNLAANATYTGSTIDRGTTTSNADTRVKPMVRHTAGLIPGHLVLEESTDGTTFYETRRSPIPSDGQFHSFDWPLHLRYWRLKFINGSTAQTLFSLLYQSSKGDGSSNDLKNTLNFLLSTTALASSATFTSTTFDLGSNHDWQSIRFFGNSDQVAANSGMRVEYSTDGTNWKWAPNVATPAAGAVTEIAVTPQTRYVRAVWVNGATAQTNLFLSLTLISL